MRSASDLLSVIRTDPRALARCLSYVENDLPEGRQLLKDLNIDGKVPVIGFTGAPGAGKSTLIDALLSELAGKGSRVAVLAIDPTSPFNLGSLLGDRIRMAGQAGNESVFIRSLATRGAVGGLSIKTIELTDVLRSAGFDYVFIETVGVGQSELDIAGLADLTVVVLVPGGGDEIQFIKSGIMEIGDIFVVNKADREGADQLEASIIKILQDDGSALPVFKTDAIKGSGIAGLAAALTRPVKGNNTRKPLLLAEKAWKLIESRMTRSLNKQALADDLLIASKEPGFNLYRFVEGWNAVNGQQ